MQLEVSKDVRLARPASRSGLLLTLGFVLLCGAPTACGQEGPAGAAKEKKDDAVSALKNPFPNAPDAPPLEGGSAWLNSAGPIELSKLRGKVVLLDFWTYCCINCIHVLPDLARLEEKYPNELVVIGVHSAKFDGEKVTDNIREAIMRYEIAHPVVNDDEMQIWRRYGVNSWPTRVLIDPEGKLIGGISGEGRYEVFDEVIRQLIAYHKAKGTLDTTPLHFQLEKFGTANTPLRYPGKLLADPKGNRLFVSDSTHHRLVIADLESGKLLDTIGTGAPGHKDGGYDEAQFDDPQGLALDGTTLYVADRRSHRLRKVDLESKEVSTYAGTGTRGGYNWEASLGTEIALASPWDLLIHEGTLYIAMAGSHQIWSTDLSTGITGPFAGTGAERLIDGKYKASAFSQPSGLTTDGRKLYVADSETSAIRSISLTNDRVDTLVGEGLFDFGDVDGVGDEVRLQHALGVAYNPRDGLIYIADTYNNKLKRLDPTRRECVTFLGDGKPGLSNDPPRFDEPGGLSLVGDKLYVADTNNHAIRVVDLTSNEVSTLEIEGLEPPQVEAKETEVAAEKTTELPKQTLAPKTTLTLKGQVTVREGEKLNPMAPMRYEVAAVDESGTKRTLAKARIEPIAAEFTVTTPELDLAGVTALEVAVVFYPCETGAEGVCRVDTHAWKLPIELASSAKGEQTIELGK